MAAYWRGEVYRWHGPRRCPRSLSSSKPDTVETVTYHVFIDNSNIFGGTLRTAARVEAHIPWPAIRLYTRHFITLIEGGQAIGQRVFAGSVPPGNEDLWEYAREMGYNTDLLRKVERDDGRLGEQGVDELLHLKIANLLLDVDPPETLVLATGDGRLSQFGTGFGAQAERALKRGWKVEVWSWAEQLSGVYGRLQTQYPGKLRIHELDPFYYSITFVQAGTYVPPAVAAPTPVAGRIVSSLPSGLKVYK